MSHFSNGKKLTKLIFYLTLVNIIFSIITSKKINFQPEYHNQNIRNLQYAIHSVYYNIVYPANDITGTGDKLKDVPYKVLCKLKSCDTGCCVGEIDYMSCGLASDCRIYSDYSKIGGMVAAIVIPIGVSILLILLFVFLFKVKKYTCGSAFCLCLACLLIIPIPIVLYYCFCKKNSSVTTEDKKDR